MIASWDDITDTESSFVDIVFSDGNDSYFIEIRQSATIQMIEEMSDPGNTDIYDVSADAEMMLHAVARNDAMFALHVPKARIISEATSLPKAASFARQGKHHSKSSDLVDKPLLFVGVPERIRTADLPLRRRMLYPAELRRQYAIGRADLIYITTKMRKFQVVFSIFLCHFKYYNKNT